MEFSWILGESWDVHIVAGSHGQAILGTRIYLHKHDIHIDILLSMYLYMNCCFILLNYVQYIRIFIVH